jgi:hypothetical protein
MNRTIPLLTALNFPKLPKSALLFILQLPFYAFNCPIFSRSFYEFNR